MFSAKKRLLAVAFVAVLGVAQMIPASAGSAGQQIRLYDYNAVGYAEFVGYNHLGAWGMHYAGGTPNGGSNWFNMWGYWWQATVYIDTWTNGGAYRWQDTCIVPWNQPGNDWTNCYV